MTQWYNRNFPPNDVGISVISTPLDVIILALIWTPGCFVPYLRTSHLPSQVNKLNTNLFPLLLLDSLFWENSHKHKNSWEFKILDSQFSSWWFSQSPSSQMVDISTSESQLKHHKKDLQMNSIRGFQIISLQQQQQQLLRNPETIRSTRFMECHTELFREDQTRFTTS